MTITVPTTLGNNPLVVIVNGVQYKLGPGETITVPDEVVAEMHRMLSAEIAKVDTSGTQGVSVTTRGTGKDSAMTANNTTPNTASGNSSFAAGSGTVASGASAVAVGGMSIASGDGAFAGGRKAPSVDYPTIASGDDSFAFGLSAKATGNKSVALGQLCEAEAPMSQALGNGTKTTGRAAMTIGQYNVADDNDVDTTHGSGARKYILIIGNGTSDEARSNAMTVDWDGNGVFDGKLTVGTAPSADLDVATKKYVDDAIAAALGG